MKGRRGYDVVVVGAGHNGLLAAAYLARAGYEVLVVERNEQIGGAVASGEPTRPDFVHDLYATNMNLFLGSPAYAELGDELAGHGLKFAHTSKPYASVFPDGRSLRVFQDRARTRAEISAHDAADAEGWDRLATTYDRFAPTLFDLYGTRVTPLPAGRWLASALRHHGARGVTELGQLVLGSTRELGDAYLRSDEAKAMIAAWGMHIDFGPDISFGALFSFLETFSAMDNGISVVAGGAGDLPRALAEVGRAAGAEIRVASSVVSILSEDGVASGVELGGGEQITARRAVIANLTPKPLSRLLPDDAAGAASRRALARYMYGPGTMVVHVALNGVIPWSARADLAEWGYVHLGPYVSDMAQTYVDAVNGVLPSEPLLVVGQTSAVDPSRAPRGGSVVWIQVRMLPTEIRADARGEIGARDWAAAKGPYAERVLGKVEDYAPGFRERILDWAVVGPDDLEAANPNLVGGDSVGGSHRISQNALFRPGIGVADYRLPLDRLLMVGAGTWPGAGVNGISGRLVAGLLIDGGRAGISTRARRASAAVGRALSARR